MSAKIHQLMIAVVFCVLTSVPSPVKLMVSIDISVVFLAA